MKPAIPTDGGRAAAFGEWTLYELPLRPGASFLWLPFKLMLPPATRRHVGRARVHRMAWNPIERRLARGRDVTRLKAQEPDLYLQVEGWLDLHCGKDWLLADDDEIRTEVARVTARREAWARLSLDEKTERLREQSRLQSQSRRAARERNGGTV